MNYLVQTEVCVDFKFLVHTEFYCVELNCLVRTGFCWIGL